MELRHDYIASLVVRTQHDDSDAFAELYSLTYNKVYNYARHYLRDDYLAQDAVQEIFINALKNINKINDPSLFIAWLNQISFRICFDMKKRAQADYGEADQELLEAVSDSHADRNPEAYTLGRDEKSRLKDAIEKLTPTEKQLITLRYFNNMKIDEIVGVLDFSKSTVKRYLASAQEKLQTLMRE